MTSPAPPGAHAEAVEAACQSRFKRWAPQVPEDINAVWRKAEREQMRRDIAAFLRAKEA